MLGPLLMMGASGAGASQTLPDAILALSPFGYWKLDETSGTTITDYGSVGANDTISGGYSLAAQAGPDGNSYARFKEGGTAARVAINDNNNWSANFYVSAIGLVIFALVYPDASGDVITKGGASSYEWRLGASSNVSATLWGSAGNNLQSESSGTEGATGQWNAVAVEFHSVNYNDRPTLYMNSDTAVSATQGSTSNANGYSNGTNQVNIGWRSDGGGSPFDGAIAHAAIFPADTDLSSVFAAASADGWI